ncbi:tryptophan-associated membrane protein [Pseudonocardia sp. N23]|nr:tryptophan-associated membrane protein [Pseudonocardia sp. N23]
MCAALAVGALATWGGARPTWFSATVPTVRGDVEAAASGIQVQPVPTALALLAAAGIAAAVAVSGVARRVLGGLLALVAVVTVWAVVATCVSPPTAARLAQLAGLTVAPGAAGDVSGTAAPVITLVGAVLVGAAGALLALREKGMPRLGARYDAPSAQRRPAPADPDRAAWEDLDAGRDPTLGPAPDATDDRPGRGGGEGAV